MYFKKVLFIISILVYSTLVFSQNITYKIVDTNLKTFYNNTSAISEPTEKDDFFGQDAHYNGFQSSYSNNGDSTITDNVTGLIWQQNMGEKISFDDAFIKAEALTLGGYTDWRVPSLKELYSLILFSGITGQSESNSTPYIDIEYFDQPYGNENLGERFIDAQTWSATEYVGEIMHANDGIFGVNFIDGRIKGYPKTKPATDSPNKMYFRLVRGNFEYGKNNFINNKNGTVTDLATGLMWQQTDNGQTYNWQTALEYAENMELAGHSDWRLPNPKELQSIVDYTRCPDITNSAAIDSVFYCTEINDPDGKPGHYGFNSTGTTHHDGPQIGKHAIYVAFGEAQGVMNSELLDVHGAGAQRSDPKSGEREDYPQFFGPQGDVRYVYNFVRCVRTLDTLQTGLNSIQKNDINIYPNPCSDSCQITFDENTLFSKIKVVNISGKTIKTINPDEVHSGTILVNMDKLEPGIYFLIIQGKNETISEKIIKV
ncbi:MAG: DUF1566 domain-containing protein [Draconibacterium sp.]|nr:DUF1566 domain-containing protein [Draconibacterium sp.]